MPSSRRTCALVQEDMCPRLGGLRYAYALHYAYPPQASGQGQGPGQACTASETPSPLIQGQ